MRPVGAANDDSTPRLMRSTPHPEPRKAGDRTREPHIAGSGQEMSRRSFVPEKIASCAASGTPRKVAVAATQRSASVLVAEAVAVLHAPRTQFDIVVD